MGKKRRNVSLIDLYNEEKLKPTASQNFVTDVARLLRKSPSTIMMWIKGRQSPDYANRKLIADTYGLSEETLFINNKNRKKYGSND